MVIKDYKTGNVLKETDSIAHLWTVIDEILESYQIKSYYKRLMAYNANTLWLDYGSHTNFLLIEEMSKEEIKYLGLERLFQSFWDEKKS